MKKLLIGIILTMMIAISTGCQYGAKNFGGSYNVDLPKGEKLVNVTWKNSDLWYLTKPMTENDIEEIYKLKESSTFGVLEGTVTINEHK